MSMVRIKILILSVCVVVAVTLLCSCGGETKTTTATASDSLLYLSADESFKPVLDAEVEVFEAAYPDKKIVVYYKPEAECLKDLGIDSIHMIITTRGLTDKEKSFISDSFRIEPKVSTVAYDAIAVIVNQNAQDSFFTMPEIKALISGQNTTAQVPVFDGIRATSTVRFMLDSVLKGMPLGPKVTAAQNSQGVLDYVAQNKNAVGFIGVSWIGNKEDTAQQSFLKKVKIANIQSVDNPEGYIKPYQANIYARRYPMVRDLVYVMKERENGTAHKFANFLREDRGQLIFRRAYLLPAKQPFVLRPTSLNR